MGFLSEWDVYPVCSLVLCIALLAHITSVSLRGNGLSANHYYLNHKSNTRHLSISPIILRITNIYVAVPDRNRILFRVVRFEKIAIKVIYDYPGVLPTFEIPLVVVLVLC